MTRGRPGVPPRRIRETADALLQRGIRPTVQLIRQMIGGSPNTISPVLREWRETLTPEQQLHLPLQDTEFRRAEIPATISDLATELWQRAIVFATIECRGSPQALQLATLSEESEQLREDNRQLRDNLEKELTEVANLRLQLAELQAVVRSALEKAKNSEARSNRLMTELHTAKARSNNTALRRAASTRVARELRQARKSPKARPQRRSTNRARKGG